MINNEINNKIKNYSINKSDLETYYNVGKLLIEAQGGEMRAKYGNSLIKEYSKRLTSKLGKGYSPMSLKYMRKFYLFQKRQPLVVQLSWSHYTILMSLNDDNKISYYIDQCIKYNCYVVVELKIISLKKEHIGQIETYMNYIDKHIKEITHDKTIGIIITKQGNDFIMEYCSDKRISDTTYLLSR